jgi:hypothetical protein
VTTNILLITDSLREIGVIAETESPSAEQGEHALRAMNQMLEQWEADEIRLEFFAQSSTTDTCPIPAYAERGVKLMLAIELAPTYGATVSIELATKASEAFGTIRRTAVLLKLPSVKPDRPRGEGQSYRQRILTGE